MAGYDHTSIPLSSESSLRVKWFQEQPFDGVQESQGELAASKAMDIWASPLESSGELLGSPVISVEQIALLESTGALLGARDIEFQALLETIDELYGNLDLGFQGKLESLGELTGRFVLDKVHPAILESHGMLVCSSVLFKAWHNEPFVLSDGAFLMVSSELGCFDISAIPPNLPALGTEGSLEAEVVIEGDVTISWGTLESSGQVEGSLIREVAFPATLESQDSIFCRWLAIRSIFLEATPQESFATLRATPLIENPPSGFVMHSTDFISLTKPLDLVKLNPKEVTDGAF